MADDDALFSGLDEIHESSIRCAVACNACADACLAEQEVANLTKCIRLDINCADICDTTARIVGRQGEVDVSLVDAQVRTCLVACARCAEECEQHASKHEHCRQCAEACRECEQACRRLLDGLSQRAAA